MPSIPHNGRSCARSPTASRQICIHLHKDKLRGWGGGGGWWEGVPVEGLGVCCGSIRANNRASHGYVKSVRTSPCWQRLIKVLRIKDLFFALLPANASSPEQGLGAMHM